MQYFIKKLYLSLFFLMVTLTTLMCLGQANVHSKKTEDTTVYKLSNSLKEDVGKTRDFSVTAGSNTEQGEMIRVDNMDDGGSSWTGSKSGSVANFHGVQKQDISGIFTPTFTGRAKVVGSGGGEKKSTNGLPMLNILSLVSKSIEVLPEVILRKSLTNKMLIRLL
jgi:hypothetical protein